MLRDFTWLVTNGWETLSQDSKQLASGALPCHPVVDSKPILLELGIVWHFKEMQHNQYLTPNLYDRMASSVALMSFTLILSLARIRLHLVLGIYFGFC